jgi:hypothetical protein
VLIPELNLSYGQVAWVLNAGAPAPRALLDQLNYLRQLGIPFSPKERRHGRGHRLRYGYDHLVECGVGLYALRHHIKPADVKRVLVTHRVQMRARYRQALGEQPEAALRADWVKSGGTIGVLLGDEIWLRLHDRFAEEPGAFELVGPGDLDVPEGSGVFDLVERFHGQQMRGLVPLTRLVLQWTAWALKAPETKPGPKA